MDEAHTERKRFDRGLLRITPGGGLIQRGKEEFGLAPHHRSVRVRCGRRASARAAHIESSVSMKQYLRWPHLSIDFGQRGVDQILEARDSPRRIAVAMPYHVLGTSILPGTELLLTVPARLAAEFADPRRTRVLAAPRELGDLHFYSVWHPRADQDPSHTWLREIVRTVAAATPPRRRRASKTIAGA